MRYKRLHPELTDEQIIERYKHLDKEELAFSKKCRKFKVNYDNALYYRKSHPELTDEQVILHYRPDLVVNIAGELMEV